MCIFPYTPHLNKSNLLVKCTTDLTIHCIVILLFTDKLLLPMICVYVPHIAMRTMSVFRLRSLLRNWNRDWVSLISTGQDTDLITGIISLRTRRDFYSRCPFLCGHENKIEYCIQIYPFDSNAMYVSCWTLQCSDFIYCLVGDVWCFLPQLLPKRFSGWGECPQRNVREWPAQHSHGKTTGFYYKSRRNFYIKLKWSGRFFVWRYFEMHLHLRDCLLGERFTSQSGIALQASVGRSVQECWV